ncbi:hypothetical protein F5888DRAFT_1890368 [Russula emetica]|nr:hypothetical protein F5888DRAFT_1890368 [Russula emetica]
MYPEEKRYDVWTTDYSNAMRDKSSRVARGLRLSRMCIPMHDTTHGPILRDWQMQTLIISRRFKSIVVRKALSDSHVRVTLPGTSCRGLSLGISCRKSDWQLSSLTQVCSSSLPQALIQTVELLRPLERGFLLLHRQDDVENSQWLELLRQLTAVKTLYLSKEFVPRFGPFTQELVEGSMTEVLSALQNLFLEELHPSGPIQEAIWKFVAARWLSNQAIAISHWEREYEWRGEFTIL